MPATLKHGAGTRYEEMPAALKHGGYGVTEARRHGDFFLINKEDNILETTFYCASGTSARLILNYRACMLHAHLKKCCLLNVVSQK